MIKLYWKKILFILDIGIILYTPLYFLYKLYPLFLVLTGSFVDRVIFDMRSANVFGILFVITLVKLLFGIIYFIILQVKYKQHLLKNNKKYYYLWIIFSILIISYAIVLIITNTYNSYYNLIYSVLIIIGTFCWLKVMLNNFYMKKILMIIFIVFNIISNYLLIVLGFIISIY
jgi:hypothetical protein